MLYHPQIETFIYVAESKSFSQAAERLYMTPTAVMKQINNLEERLGVLLFERNNHGLALTKAGESLYKDSKYLVDYSQRAIEKVKSIAQQEHQTSIRIGTSVMTPAKFVMDIWSDLQSKDKHLKIELVPFDNTPENAREILKNLGNQIDVVAGIYDDNLMKERRFQVAPLEDKKVLFAFPINNPLSQKEVLTLEDMKQNTVMFIKKGWNCHIDQLRKTLEENKIEIVDFDFYNLNAFNIAVKENRMIVAVDGWENIHPLLKLVPIEIECSVPYGIMYSLTPSPIVRHFIDTVSEINAKKK